MHPVANHLLNTLPPAVLQDLVRRFRTVSLAPDDILSIQESKSAFSYFLNSGVASVVMTGLDGTTVDVETIGCEGVIGAGRLLGEGFVPSLCVMRLAGDALRIPVESLRQLFLHSSELRGRMLEFVQMQAAMLGLISGCNRLHGTQQRLARILLMVQDRAGGDTFKLTQESLAQMLGTQRTTVCLLAAELQDRGLLEYSRGRLRLTDRPGLEEVACECYAVSRGLLTELYRNADRPVLRSHVWVRPLIEAL